MYTVPVSTTTLHKQHSPGGIREMMAVAVPMVISNACDTVMTFTDRLMLAQLGPEVMSAAMAGGLTVFMLLTFFLGLTGYSSALVAQYLGAGQKNRCAMATSQALIQSLIAYPIVLACGPVGHAMFAASNISPQQLIPQKQYYDFLLWGSVISLLRHSMSCFFSGIGKTRIVMIASVVAMVMNVIGNYAFIFGHFGFPRMEIRGAALGTIFGGACGLLILVIGYLQPVIRREFAVLRALRYDRETMRKLFRFGYPAGVEFFLNLLAFDMLILAFHSRGVEAATAITVVFNWDMVSFVPLIGINIGVTSLVGRYMGARQPDIAHKATMSGFKMAYAYGFCTLIAFSLFAGPLVHVFKPQTSIDVFNRAEPMAIFMLRLASLYVLADATNLVFSGALRGAGDTLWAMIISVGLHWVLVGALLAMLHFGADVKTAWMALVVLIWLFTLVFYARYRSGKWRTMRVVDSDAQVPLLLRDGLHETADL